jgi:hypothetical protein
MLAQQSADLETVALRGDERHLALVIEGTGIAVASR